MSGWRGGEQGGGATPSPPPPPPPPYSPHPPPGYSGAGYGAGYGAGGDTEATAYGEPASGYGYGAGTGHDVGYPPLPGSAPPRTGGYADPTYLSGLTPAGTRPSRRFGVVGTLAALVGGGMVAVSFTLLDWLAPGQHSTFHDIHNSLTGTNATYAKDYFSWLGWVALGVVVVLALAANLPTPLHVGLRPLGAIAALAAIGATVYAIERIPGGSWTRVYDYAIAGTWCAVVGFAVAGVGALVGSRPARSR